MYVSMFVGMEFMGETREVFGRVVGLGVYEYLMVISLVG